MAGGQLANVTLSAGSSSQGGLLQNVRLTGSGHNGSGLQLADDTLFAQGTTGNLSRVGSLAIALDPATFIGHGSPVATGNVGINLSACAIDAHDSPQDVILRATGTVAHVGTGGILQPALFTCTGHLEPNPALDVTLGGLTVVGAGTNAPVPTSTGALAATLGSIAIFSVGRQLPIINGALSSQLGDVFSATFHFVQQVTPGTFMGWDDFTEAQIQQIKTLARIKKMEKMREEWRNRRIVSKDRKRSWRVG